MLYYDAAVGAESGVDAEAARAWLLTYNRGDVEATLLIHDWLASDSGSILSIEPLDPSLG